MLVDHRRLNCEDFSASNLLTVVETIEKYLDKNGAGPCAVLVDNPVAFGIARMYGLYGGEFIHSRYNVFYSKDDAVMWLMEQESQDGQDDT